MPYESVWVTPELFMTHNGVNIFHTYKDDEVGQGCSFFWYTLYSNNDDYPFDVRELPGGHDRASMQGDADTHMAIIRQALDAGLIELPDDMADNEVSA